MLATRNLTKNFDDLTAVRRVNLAIEKGSVYGFLGANGAGKTTTIKMLMGLLVPSEGQASIGGLDCHKDSLAVKKLVGYLPDTPNFPNFLKGVELLQMAAELHGMPRRDARRRAETLIDWIGLREAADEYSINYSIGMKKRLGLACAAVHDPAVLLLDEPTNGLDPYATRLVGAWIQDMASQGKTILVSTHRLEWAERICTHLGVLHRGELREQGELEAIKEKLATPHLEDIFFALTAPGADHASDA